jgi:hypothetical protein
MVFPEIRRCLSVKKEKKEKVQCRAYLYASPR